jgi:hypothetical protein
MIIILKYHLFSHVHADIDIELCYQIIYSACEFNEFMYIIKTAKIYIFSLSEL